MLIINPFEFYFPMTRLELQHYYQTVHQVSVKVIEFSFKNFTSGAPSCRGHRWLSLYISYSPLHYPPHYNPMKNFLCFGVEGCQTLVFPGERVRADLSLKWFGANHEECHMRPTRAMLPKKNGTDQIYEFHAWWGSWQINHYGNHQNNLTKSGNKFWQTLPLFCNFIQ